MKRILSLALWLWPLPSPCPALGRRRPTTPCSPPTPSPPTTAPPNRPRPPWPGSAWTCSGTWDQTEKPPPGLPSAALALSMASNGADGDTLEQFEAVLSGEAGLDVLNALVPGAHRRLSKPGRFHGVLHRQQPVGGPGWDDPGGLHRPVPGHLRRPGDPGPAVRPGIVPPQRLGVRPHQRMIRRSSRARRTSRPWSTPVPKKHLGDLVERPADHRTELHLGGAVDRIDFLRPLTTMRDRGRLGPPYDDGRMAFFGCLADGLHPAATSTGPAHTGLPGAGGLFPYQLDGGGGACWAMGLELAFDSTGRARPGTPRGHPALRRRSWPFALMPEKGNRPGWQAWTGRRWPARTGQPGQEDYFDRLSLPKFEAEWKGAEGCADRHGAGAGL